METQDLEPAVVCGRNGDRRHRPRLLGGDADAARTRGGDAGRCRRAAYAAPVAGDTRRSRRTRRDDGRSAGSAECDQESGRFRSGTARHDRSGQRPARHRLCDRNRQGLSLHDRRQNRHRRALLAQGRRVHHYQGQSVPRRAPPRLVHLFHAGGIAAHRGGGGAGSRCLGRHRCGADRAQDPGRVVGDTAGVRAPRHADGKRYIAGSGESGGRAMSATIASLRTRALRFGQRLMHKPRIDLPLAIALLILACVGLITLYSASDLDTGVIGGQAARFLLGAILMIVISRIPPTMLRTWTPWFYAISAFLLLVVAALGEGRGANRWLDLRVIRFQPSEFLKLSMPMMIAWYLHPRQLPPGWKDIFVVGLLVAIPSALIAKEPDLGTALLVAASGIFVLFLSGIAWWRVGLMLGALAGAAPVAWHFLHDYQRQRVLTFLHPENDPLGNGWHIIQSMIAVGSGGVFGKGWHHGTQSRLEFLPEHTTDFIFAVYSEEFGLIGVLLLLAF